MRILSLFILFFITSGIQAQNLTNYELVDKFKIMTLALKVYFKDPLKQLIMNFTLLNLEMLVIVVSRNQLNFVH